MAEAFAEDLLVGPPTLRASVRVEDPAWSMGDPVAVADMVLTALSARVGAPRGCATADLLYADDAALADLNARYRHKDGPTNVLAFPSSGPHADGEPIFLGGVALASGVAEREARERGIPLSHHTTHLTLHGLLHLLGYDHERDEDRTAMEGVEIAILSQFGIANPYEGS